MNVVDKIYDEYEDRRLEKANQFLTNLFISRFADLLGAVGGLNAIESSKTLNDDLQKDRLLKSDVGSIVRSTGYPFWRDNDLKAYLRPYG